MHVVLKKHPVAKGFEPIKHKSCQYRSKDSSLVNRRLDMINNTSPSLQSLCISTKTVPSYKKTKI